MRTYVTVAIPYVNARPHLGYAYELVLADVYARSRRLAGDAVRFLGGTDDYSLKNVLAAEAAGVPIPQFVDEHGSRFQALAEPLDLSFDDFIRTSADERHAPAVERLWRACAATSDLYKRPYEGDYCVGCEQFCTAADLVGGLRPEHGTPPGTGGRGELVLPSFRLPGPPRAARRIGRAGHPARAVPPGGPGLASPRRPGLQRVPISG